MHYEPLSSSQFKKASALRNFFCSHIPHKGISGYAEVILSMPKVISPFACVQSSKEQLCLFCCYKMKFGWVGGRVGWGGEGFGLESEGR